MPRWQTCDDSLYIQIELLVKEANQSAVLWQYSWYVHAVGFVQVSRSVVQVQCADASTKFLRLHHQAFSEA